ncbi:YdcH family protein [Rhodoferax sp.]|uniref:YdcH family protein n=1 Tax=Rhodoferax sp. TaxID=50421 RepID=UPI00374D5841
MFPEFRDQITQLKSTDGHFARLFEQHSALDQQVLRMQSHAEPSTPLKIELLKKEKLLLKDQIHAILKKAALG